MRRFDVPFCCVAAYFGTPFGTTGEALHLDSYFDCMDAYQHGMWDRCTADSSYKFNHEALMVTYADLEEEVDLMFECSDRFSAAELALLVEPYLSISAHCVSKGLVTLKKSIDHVRTDGDGGGGGQGSGAAARGSAIKHTDTAFMGHFKRLGKTSGSGHRVQT